jgi:hypothetical protein
MDLSLRIFFKDLSGGRFPDPPLPPLCFLAPSLCLPPRSLSLYLLADRGGKKEKEEEDRETGGGDIEREREREREEAKSASRRSILYV